MNTALNAVQQTALAKAAKVAKIDEGRHTFDFIVRIKGEMNQGADYRQRIVPKANLTTLLTLALSKMNGTTAEFVANLVREAADIDADPTKAEAMEAELEKIKGYADEAMAKIKDATWSDCKGKLTAKVDAEIVSVAVENFMPAAAK